MHFLYQVAKVNFKKTFLEKNTQKSNIELPKELFILNICITHLFIKGSLHFFLVMPVIAKKHEKCPNKLHHHHRSQLSQIYPSPQNS
jgi:hypothetical protein